MKALIFQDANQISLEERPKPSIQKPTDCIVKMTHSTICGTDLHIIKGDVPEVKKGRILGHEGIGIVEEVGSAVSNFKKDDKVLISCISSCGKCVNCKKQMYSHCEDGGWLLGHLIDGTQAEYVRIPFADNSLYPIPPHLDNEDICMFSDVLPTAFETGVLKGRIKLGDRIAIIGSGPIGCSVLLTAQFFSPSEIILVDRDEFRLEVAKKLGATITIKDDGKSTVQAILNATNQKGVDVAIEAVGTPDAFDICQSILAPGGTLANIGVHGKSVNLHLEKLWSQNITLTTTLVDTFSIPTLINTYICGKLQPQKLITHRFDFHDILKAYDVFSKAATEHALKVILKICI